MTHTKESPEYPGRFIPPEIVSSLPALPDSNYPQGRLVVLITDNKLYRSTGPTWTTATDGADIVANSIIAGSFAVGAVAASDINVTNLAAIKADMGVITAGTITLDSTGHIKSGQTAYDTGTGFFLGKDGATTKLSLGDSTGNNMTWDGTGLAITGDIDMTNAVSTFTPGWTGFSTNPTGDLSYIDFGAFVVLWTTPNINGTSNAAFMTITGMPAAIQVTGVKTVSTIVTDNGVSVATEARVIVGGSISFFKFQTSGSDIIVGANTFVTSGTKGLPSGWMIVYPKN